MIPTKFCIRCETHKPIDCFSKTATYCRMCKLAYDRAYDRGELPPKRVVDTEKKCLHSAE